MWRTGRGPSRASLVSECGRGGWVLVKCVWMWGSIVSENAGGCCWSVGGLIGGRMEGCGLGEGAAFFLVVEGLGGSG